ncbi:MAG TPA: hypothetical protein EYQ81_03350 [Sneathiellales bacterium]|nr:hypothetical protein [Sneathiellales bacterium]
MVSMIMATGRADLREVLSRNVRISGRRTSVRLEAPMWDALDDICDRERKSVNEISTLAAQTQRDGGFTSALRVFILNYYRASEANFGDGKLSN